MKKIVLPLLLGTLFFTGISMVSAQVIPEGKFLSFNGIDQFLSIANHNDFNILAGESYTISCRIRPENFNGTYSILSKGNELIPMPRYELFTYKSESGPNLGLNLRNSEAADLGAPNFCSLSAGTWVHLAWVYSVADKSSKVYINGVLVKTTFSSTIGRGNIININDLTVGCSFADAAEPEPHQFWPGELDELRVWKKALQEADIVADKSSPKAVGTALVAAYDFENTSSNSVPDVSGKGHHARLTGYGVKVVKTLLPLGIGDVNERLVCFRVIGLTTSETITNITVDLSGTTSVSDISVLRAYYNGSSERLNLRTARLVGTSTVVKTKTILPVDVKLAPGDNYFWITADISQGASEGDKVCSTVLSYVNSDRNVVSLPVADGSRTILLANKLLYSCGDAGSKNYRIPAIVTAHDGSLVTATDKRWNSLYDLPGHIDVVIKRSTDNGQTWSNPLTIAGEGTITGFGDPALVLNHKNHEIICLMAVDKGFFNSTSTLPIRIYQSISADNGITWTTARDITPQIYGGESSNLFTQGWQGAFVTSGSALQLRNGRLMAAMPVRETNNRVVSTYIIYSDDNARTWKVSAGRAAVDGSEAKLTELDNGKILMSIRNQGNRVFNLSSDKGMTWGVPYEQPAIKDPGCNGDMIRYTSVSAGYKRNRLLHSIPYSTSRKNVSVLLSYDEGATWPLKKTIYPGASAYSALTILNDGSIGMYYEVGEYENYQMYFTRFSLTWLSDGADVWTKRVKPILSSTDDIADNLAAYSVYPNPAEGFVNISGAFNWDSRIEIYDTKGMMVSSMKVENPTSTVQVSLEGLASGTYFVKIVNPGVSNGGSVIRLVVK